MQDIITEIKLLWPSCKMVHGRARHSESHGGIERLNRTVEGRLGTWLHENNSKHWSIGRMIVTWQINTAHPKAVGAMPYMLAFGQQPRVGISALPLAPELLDTLATEAELNTAVGLNEDAVLEEATTIDMMRVESAREFLIRHGWSAVPPTGSRGPAPEGPSPPLPQERVHLPPLPPERGPSPPLPPERGPSPPLPSEGVAEPPLPPEAGTEPLQIILDKMLLDEPSPDRNAYLMVFFARFEDPDCDPPAPDPPEVGFNMLEPGAYPELQCLPIDVLAFVADVLGIVMQPSRNGADHEAKHCAEKVMGVVHEA
eukprot:6176471-Pleurochrysis_carterae.AAC.1